MLCEYGCKNEAKFKMTSGKMCCESHYSKCPELRKKNSEGLSKAHKRGVKFGFNGDSKSCKSMISNWRVTQQKIQDALPFEQKSLAEQYRIVLREQNGKCLFCGIDSWNDKSLKLHMDHIDGNNLNNERINLRYLCPNCHSQTETYCGRNIVNQNIKKVSDLEFINALKSTPNIRQALIKCKLADKGGNYSRAKKLILENNL